jgi:hypothetical protein
VIPTRLANRYEVLGEFGRGAMGVAHRAKDRFLSARDRQATSARSDVRLLRRQPEVRVADTRTVLRGRTPAGRRGAVWGGPSSLLAAALLLAGVPQSFAYGAVGQGHTSPADSAAVSVTRRAPADVVLRRGSALGAPSFTRISPGPNYECYASGTLPLAFGDYDNDGFLDLPLYHNDGGTGFSETPGVRDLLNGATYHGAAWGDYDGDGWPDLVILGYGIGTQFFPSVLLHNEGNGTFRDVAPDLGLDVAGYGETACWGDYDGDGHLDLFAPYYPYSFPFRSLLYRSNGDGTFTESCSAAGVCLDDLPPGFTPEGAQWADWNNDGHLDLYCAGHLFLNDGSGSFIDVRESVGLPELFDEGSMFIDYDNDGDLDLYIRTFDGGHLFRNDGGEFTDVTAAAGIPSAGFLWGDTWADVNNDGWLDLLYMRWNAPALLLMNQGDGTFLADSAFTALNLQADASSWGDWDNDGDLDLVVGAGCHRFYRNDADQAPGFAGSYLRVRVLDALGHQTQYGATVRLKRVDLATPQVQTRVVDGGSGYLSQRQYDAHFGVDPNATYSLEVTFPSPPGPPLVVDSTVDPRLGSIVPGQLTDKVVTISRGGCVLIDEAAVPRIVRISGTQPSCAGDSITLDAGPGFGSYAWSTGDTTQTISVAPVSTTTYSVHASNACFTAIGGYRQEVEPEPSAALSGGASLCPGTAAAIQVDLTGSAPWTILWSDGYEQTVSSSPVRRIVSPTETTVYQIVSVKAGACTHGTVSGSAIITVESCGSGVPSGTLLADGRTVTSILSPAGNSYSFTAQAGRSYAAEVDVTPGSGSGASAPSPHLSLTLADGSTPLASPALDTTACAPGALPRLAFLPSAADVAAGPLRLSVSDPVVSGYAIRPRIIETTVYCPRWSTNGYLAFADLQNTSSCALDGQLDLFDGGGLLLANLPFSLATSGALQIQIPTGLTSTVGSARVSHDGPPAALTGGIYMVQPGASGVGYRWPFLEVRAYGSSDGR